MKSMGETMDKLYPTLKDRADEVHYQSIRIPPEIIGEKKMELGALHNFMMKGKVTGQDPHTGHVHMQITHAEIAEPDKEEKSESSSEEKQEETVLGGK